MRKTEASDRSPKRNRSLEGGGESILSPPSSFFMMSQRAWILVGMMGVGKSTAGGIVAERAGREHLDTDRMLIRKLGRPIPQLFQLLGESTFRDHETTLLRELSPGRSVISTGGGIVVRPQNWDEMRRLGTTIFMDVPFDILIARLHASKKRRPLLQGEDMESKVAAILEARLPLYRQADLTVTLEHLDANDSADRILAALGVKA